MDDPFQATGLPRGPLLAATLLVALTIVAVALVRVTGVGAAHAPTSAPVAVADFRFLDQPDGGVLVVDAASEEVLQRFDAGTHGFLRSTLRGLARERKRQALGPGEPFRLIGRADGRLTLADPATGREVDLGAFGPTNAAVFAQLLDASVRRRAGTPARSAG